MRFLSAIALLGLAIGGINYGLLAFFGINAITHWLGDGMVSRVIFGLVGVAGLYGLFLLAWPASEWSLCPIGRHVKQAA